MNGKSGNLNSCAAQLYPSGCLVPSSELICILDADQASSCDPLVWRLETFQVQKHTFHIRNFDVQAQCTSYLAE